MYPAAQGRRISQVGPIEEDPAQDEEDEEAEDATNLAATRRVDWVEVQDSASEQDPVEHKHEGGCGKESCERTSRKSTSMLAT